MAFGSTLVLPHADGNITLNKINQDGYTSEYMFRNTTYQVVAKVRHSTVNRGTKASPVLYDRHNVEVVRTIFAAGGVAEHQRKCYFVSECLPSDTDVKDIDALFGWAIATSDANLAALLTWQS